MEEGSGSQSQARDRCLHWTKKILNGSYDQNMERYSVWAETYDDDILRGNRYHGHEIAAKYMNIYCKYLDIKHDSKILDIGAGTGLVGKALGATFTNLEALDASEEMLGKAGQLGIYKNTILAKLGGSQTLPIDSDCYDAVVMCAAVAPGHLDDSCLPEIIRIVKPGGLILNVTRKVYVCQEEGKECLTDFIPTCDRWEREGKWKTVDIIIPKHMQYAIGVDAIVLAHQVL